LIAWFMHDEGKRGIAQVGKLAELAVLSKSYLLVSVDQVGGIESVVTMVGRKVVFAADQFKNSGSSRAGAFARLLRAPTEARAR